jgi:alkylhydroperoxidase family enzyme
METNVDASVAERMQQITGASARIDALDQSAIDEAALALIRRLAASAGNPQTEFPVINRYLRTIMKHPRLLETQVAIGGALFAGVIPARERELAVLRVAWLCGAPYEWAEHVRIAKRCGITAAQIEQAIEGSGCPAWAPGDRAIVRGVEELVADHMISDETWQALAGMWDECQLIEFPMVVGQYIATACMQNALRIPLSRQNRGLFER